MSEEQSQPESKPLKTMAEFLISAPPDVIIEVGDLANYYSQIRTDLFTLQTPDFISHCTSSECEGARVFYCTEGLNTFLERNQWKNCFLKYVCRNCRKKLKIFALAALLGKTGFSGHIHKFGEIPAFGPHTPPRVITLIGPDRELFLQGRRAENHGMGIGAFSYYRRVVENQKGRIIGEIAKVAEKLGAKPDVLAAFMSAKSETQFSKAVDEIKNGIPETLLIDGHNPLTLLHTALSEGLHAGTDKECLEIAQEIRLVLTELAERISLALKEEAELKTAVSRLLNRKKPATSMETT